MGVFSKRKTTAQFISEAKDKHDNKYDYCNVDYQGKDVKVCIVCPTHGDFWQTPHSHLNGNGCPKCAHDKTRKRLNSNTEEFIRRAKERHGDKYDYSKVSYKDSQTKVCIICPIHGEFWMTPNKHLQGQGCKYCSRLRLAFDRQKSVDEFVRQAKEIHGNRYDYSKVEYKNGNTKVCIICKIHGKFWQNPNSHLQGCGCKKCGYSATGVALRKTNDMFIEQAKIVHGDRYDYTSINYIKSDEKICIICPEHGEFWQEPYSHLNGCGCPCCRESHGEREIAKWLDTHGIKYQREYTVYPSKVLFGKNRFYVDFKLHDTCVFIEYHGKQHYEDINFYGRTTEQFQAQQDRDRRLREYCKQHKIRLIEIPYTEFDNIDKILTRKLLKSKKK